MPLLRRSWNLVRRNGAGCVGWATPRRALAFHDRIRAVLRSPLARVLVMDSKCGFAVRRRAAAVEDGADAEVQPLAPADALCGALPSENSGPGSCSTASQGADGQLATRADGGAEPPTAPQCQTEEVQPCAELEAAAGGTAAGPAVGGAGPSSGEAAGAVGDGRNLAPSQAADGAAADGWPAGAAAGRARRRAGDHGAAAGATNDSRLGCRTEEDLGKRPVGGGRGRHAAPAAEAEVGVQSIRGSRLFLRIGSGRFGLAGPRGFLMERLLAVCR
jgi:hypothetical protein